jgi:hypothetical protein
MRAFATPHKEVNLVEKELAKYPGHPIYQDVVIDNISKAIWAVMTEIGYVQKQKSGGLSYSFAGEAALIRAVRPFMEKYGITMHVQEQKNVKFETYQTAKGSTMNRTTCVALVVFTHAPSNTAIYVEALGEGADSGDKSGNKANTCAYKYAIRQTFMIETGDDPDEESSEKSERKAAATSQTATKPADPDKTYPALVALAEKQYKFTEDQVKKILSTHKKFDVTEWNTYLYELKAAFDNPA